MFFFFNIPEPLPPPFKICEILCKTTEDSYFGWSLEGVQEFYLSNSSKDFELKQKPWVSGKENYWYTEGQLTQYSWRSFMNNLIIFTDRESNSSTISQQPNFTHLFQSSKKSWFLLPVPKSKNRFASIPSSQCSNKTLLTALSSSCSNLQPLTVMDCFLLLFNWSEIWGLKLNFLFLLSIQIGSLFSKKNCKTKSHCICRQSWKQMLPNVKENRVYCAFFCASFFV